MRITGLGSFLAAQVIADLKNTLNHPLNAAVDWYDWAAPGPGSLRGIEWALGRRVTPSNFLAEATQLRELIYPKLRDIYELHMQDFQNCLCEFDKYMRVSTGSGVSKRRYHGI
jgi:hypothetical protein